MFFSPGAHIFRFGVRLEKKTRAVHNSFFTVYRQVKQLAHAVFKSLCTMSYVQADDSNDVLYNVQAALKIQKSTRASKMDNNNYYVAVTGRKRTREQLQLHVNCSSIYNRVAAEVRITGARINQGAVLGLEVHVHVPWL